MRGPYQITREDAPIGAYGFRTGKGLYRFTLCGPSGYMVADEAPQYSPIAPKWLRGLQARLNTTAMMAGVL